MVQTSDLKKILIIAGPTASGKTDLSLRCAKELGCEIISADSMQIYQGLDIGTGKLDVSLRQNIPHIMIDIIPPSGEFSVNEFVKRCENAIDDIISRGKIPLIVGGTGLYINGLLNGLDYAGAVKSKEIREKYGKILIDRGKEYLYDILKSIDSESCDKININDTKRVIRAIEIYELTGAPKSSVASRVKNKKYNYKAVVLLPSRGELYSRINGRVDKMIADGLEYEVRRLIEFKNCQSMQAIGYKEMIQYIENKMSLTETIDLIKTNSRHYAKRQITFFKNMSAEMNFIYEYDKNNDHEVVELFRNFIRG